MKIQEISKIIQEGFKFVKSPSESEVRNIIKDISAYTTVQEFQQIVFKNVSNKLFVCNESEDLSDLEYKLKLIKALMDKNG
nr:hypothetical protein [uncultured Campylobacter sp.]